MEGMEGGRTAGAVLAAAACALLMAGLGACGSSSGADGAVATEQPEVAFAPLVRLDPAEESLPMSVEEFLDRSVLWWKDDAGCPPRKVVVGQELRGETRGRRLTPRGLGWGPSPAYAVQSTDSKCRIDGFSLFLKSSRLTRPGGPRGERERSEAYPRDEGFYLDLDDGSRGGPPRDPEDLSGAVPAYYEKARQRVDGKPGLRIDNRLLYGMSAPSEGEPRHEGDWERVAVYLRRGEASGEWIPDSVRLPGKPDARAVRWEDVRVRDGSHPVVLSALGSHVPSLAGKCAGCADWRTWERMVLATKKRWWGYGGNWGDVGPTLAASGPAGPGAGWINR